MARCLVTAFCLLVASLVLVSHADEKSARNPAARASKVNVSKEAEKAALVFVRKQHSELADLLNSLRESNESAYQSALRDLSRDVDRLQKLADRDADRYRLSLNVWNLDSRIRLEIARLSMSSDAEVDSRLRPLMKERQTARTALLELEHKRLTDRLKKLGEQLDETRNQADARIDSEIERIQRLVSARTKGRKAAAKTRARTAKTDAKSTKTNAGGAESKSGSQKTSAKKQQ
ncbi:MAG: hypothetical protein ACYTGL_08355 [Planctomycetota bacterium]|jgi:hypothetical protein